MINNPVLTFFLFILALSACTSKNIYDNARQNRQDECRKLMNLRDREQCLEESSKSYDEYARDRREVIEDRDSN